MSDLAAKFDELRKFVEGIPADRLDMRVYPLGECGCVMAHADYPFKTRPLEPVLDNSDWDFLFQDNATSFDGFPYPYPEPKGQPAKDEFLRRLDVLRQKYVGASYDAKDAHQEGAN